MPAFASLLAALVSCAPPPDAAPEADATVEVGEPAPAPATPEDATEVAREDDEFFAPESVV